MKKTRTLAIAAVVLAVLGIGAVAYAQDAPPRPSTATDAGTAPQRHRPAVGIAGRIGRNAVHAEVKVKAKDGSFVTYTVDRGTVSAVSETSITVHREDGVDVTESLTPDTTYRGVQSWDQVRKDVPALLVSKDGGDGHTAAVVLQPTQEQQDKATQRRARIKARIGNFRGHRGVAPSEDQVPAA